MTFWKASSFAILVTAGVIGCFVVFVAGCSDGIDGYTFDQEEYDRIEARLRAIDAETDIEKGERLPGPFLLPIAVFSGEASMYLDAGDEVTAKIQLKDGTKLQLKLTIVEEPEE